MAAMLTTYESATAAFAAVADQKQQFDGKETPAIAAAIGLPDPESQRTANILGRVLRQQGFKLFRISRAGKRVVEWHLDWTPEKLAAAPTEPVEL